MLPRPARVVLVMGLGIWLIRGDYADCGPYRCTPEMWAQAGVAAIIVGLCGLLAWWLFGGQGERAPRTRR